MSRQLALSILLCLPLALPARAASPVLWGGLEPGAYDVGFTMLHLVDESRSYGASAVRERGRITPKVMYDRVELDLPLTRKRRVS